MVGCYFYDFRFFYGGNNSYNFMFLDEVCVCFSCIKFFFFCYVRWECFKVVWFISIFVKCNSFIWVRVVD